MKIFDVIVGLLIGIAICTAGLSLGGGIGIGVGIIIARKLLSDKTSKNKKKRK